MKISPLATLLLATLVAATAQTDEGEQQIEAGSRVTFNYSLSLEDGTVVDSNREGEPMAYTQGNGEIIAGLENAMLGRTAGEEFSVTLQPEDAYGVVDPSRVQEVPIDMIPEAARVEGATVTAPSYPGPIRVQEVREEAVLLDFNHPLAGRVLEFDIDVLSVDPPAAAPAPAPVD